MELPTLNDCYISVLSFHKLASLPAMAVFVWLPLFALGILAARTYSIVTDRHDNSVGSKGGRQASTKGDRMHRSLGRFYRRRYVASDIQSVALSLEEEA
jgi:hypothetical protein